MSQAGSRYMSVRTVWHNLRAARHRTNYIRHLVFAATVGGEAHLTCRNWMLGRFLSIRQMASSSEITLRFLFAGDFDGHQRRDGGVCVSINATEARVFAVLLTLGAHPQHSQYCNAGIRTSEAAIRAIEQRKRQTIGNSWLRHRYVMGWLRAPGNMNLNQNSRYLHTITHRSLLHNIHCAHFDNRRVHRIANHVLLLESQPNCP